MVQGPKSKTQSYSSLEGVKEDGFDGFSFLSLPVLLNGNLLERATNYCFMTHLFTSLI